jgi:hypothetical protein
VFCGVFSAARADACRMAIYLCLLDGRLCPLSPSNHFAVDLLVRASANSADNPHLHPSLIALHKHRLAAHGIPLPARPDIDHPVPIARRSGPTHSNRAQTAAAAGPSLHSNSAVPVPSIMLDGIRHDSMDIDTDLRHEGSRGDQSMGEKPEWLMWRLTDEESLRRKAYLPLA